MKNNQILNALNDVDEKFIEEACPMNKTTITKKPIWMKWGVLAACIAIVISSAVFLPNILNNSSVAPIEQLTPASDAPNGMRKFLNYNNNRYAFLENGATYNLTSVLLSSALGTIEHDIQSNPEENAKKDLAATYAIGGTVYQLSTYDPLFRLAVEHNGNYYICERVDSVDDTHVDISEYFIHASFPEIIKEIVIKDHVGANDLKIVSSHQIPMFIEGLSMVSTATLTSDDYGKIVAEQKSGGSYLISFELEDGTAYKIYVIPTLSLAIIGDNKYTLPDKFIVEFANLFEGLEQKTVPLQ